MTQLERIQIRFIAEDHPEALSHLQFLYNTKRSNEFFEYLIKNKLTGKRFVDFVKGQCQNSRLAMLAFLISKVEKNRELRPVYRNDLKN